MKILFVSMPSIHVLRWIENLKDKGHELYWFDVLDRGPLENLDYVCQFVNWKKRKYPYIKGEYFLRKNMPSVYDKIIPYLEVSANEGVEKVIQEIKPDIVHSFELHYCSYPILKAMNKNPDIKWIYSCWGSDIFRHQVLKNDIQKIESVLNRVNFLITDCERDYDLAKKYNFNGVFLGALPGGGGYHITDIQTSFQDIESRKLILIKGNHNETGRALYTLKAIKKIIDRLDDFHIAVFSAGERVKEFIKSDSKLEGKIKIVEKIEQPELHNYFGKAFLYIGNNFSDGMPNSLLEALLLGTIPLQSNPGNATKELIGKKYFGEIINDPENSDEIAEKIVYLIHNKDNNVQFAKSNHLKAIEDYNYERTRDSINNLYSTVAIHE
ncbi:glycosyltransferase family 4 protein [Flavobacterium tructae]|uniref:glycosyltransferase family 4 protein n=1 Tax=Flavobacterium tructae TaxID=1114873 RepID=UPI0035A93688